MWHNTHKIDIYALSMWWEAQKHELALSQNYNNLTQSFSMFCNSSSNFNVYDMNKQKSDIWTYLQMIIFPIFSTEWEAIEFYINHITGETISTNNESVNFSVDKLNLILFIFQCNPCRTSISFLLLNTYCLPDLMVITYHQIQ